MNLEDLKDAQMSEILEWADDLNNILTPDNILPVRLKDFPLAMEGSERLKRICKACAAQLKDKMQLIEDELLSKIEQEVYTFKFNAGGQAVLKKRFTSADQRQRELRKRLNEHKEYQNFRQEHDEWNMMFSDWVAHINRLRREMHLLEAEYLATGSDVWQREYDANYLDSHKV